MFLKEHLPLFQPLGMTEKRPNTGDTLMKNTPQPKADAITEHRPDKPSQQHGPDIQNTSTSQRCRRKQHNYAGHE